MTNRRVRQQYGHGDKFGEPNKQANKQREVTKYCGWYKTKNIQRHREGWFQGSFTSLSISESKIIASQGKHLEGRVNSLFLFLMPPPPPPRKWPLVQENGRVIVRRNEIFSYLYPLNGDFLKKKISYSRSWFNIFPLLDTFSPTKNICLPQNKPNIDSTTMNSLKISCYYSIFYCPVQHNREKCIKHKHRFQ